MVLLYGALGAVAFAVAGLVLRPVTFRVRRTITIHKSTDDVFEAVRDLRTWGNWSPWLIVEPESRIAFSGDSREPGGRYSWNGACTGAGEIELRRVEPPQHLALALEFFKPFRSRARVWFDFDATDAGTVVAWNLEGRIPSFLARTMPAYLGADYDRGLAMLKDWVETGSVPSSIERVGVVARPSLSYLGIRRACAIDDIGPAMEDAMTQLTARLADLALVPDGPWMSLYPTWDIPGRRCEFILAVPVPSSVADPAPDGLVRGVMASHRAFHVVHTGDYRHLGNGWVAAFMHAAAQKLKLRKTPVPYELYTNDPRTLPNDQWRTEIFLPLKGS